jgi:hypothetical protein
MIYALGEKKKKKKKKKRESWMKVDLRHLTDMSAEYRVYARVALVQSYLI